MENTICIETPTDWKDYELIDSGSGAKLERFGSYIIARPDPRAIWMPRAPKTLWDAAHATYVRKNQTEEGTWQIKTPPPNDWSVRYNDLVFTLRPTSFKHVGVFPEQAVNWQWLRQCIDNRPLRVLNLFAYTGGATMAAAAAGATVTHVDSAKSAIEWAKNNVTKSRLTDKHIRWIIDDATKFALREQRRGNIYDGIILDPPRFGRGTKGEVWKIEEDLPKLLDICRTLLSKNPVFVLINAYTADISSVVISHVLSDVTRGIVGNITFGELALIDKTSQRLLPNGIFARWQAS